MQNKMKSLLDQGRSSKKEIILKDLNLLVEKEIFKMR